MARPERANGAGWEAWSEALTDQERGLLILVMWVNALVTLGLYAGWCGFIARLMLRRRRHESLRREVLEAAGSRTAASLAVATLFHNAFRRLLVDVMDRKVRTQAWP